MAKKKSGSKKEAVRRKDQSNRDKKKGGSRKMQVVMPRRTNAKQKTRKTPGGSMPYARLVLDPCNASFAQSNMPGNSGAQQVRLPFRRICSTVSVTKGIDGQPITGGAECNTLTAVLTPHAMQAGFGPSVLTVRAQPNEVVQHSNLGIINTPYYTYADPAGLSALASFVGEMRPVAACIRITCLGSDIDNQGLFFGYEGAAKQFVKHVDDDFKNSFTVMGTTQDVIFNGQTTGDTYKTYEVRINYPNATQQWQDWRQITGPVSSLTGVVESGDASDISYSEMPIAMVGVTSAKPGVNYLFDGAIVYEWQPKTIAGLTGPKKVPSSPTALASVARTVQSIANNWGGMLISTAADYATGGNASAALSLLKQSYSAMTARRSSQPLLGF